MSSSSSVNRRDTFAPEEHVLDDVEVVAERQVLIHGLDPERGGFAGRPDVNGLPLPRDLTALRGVDPGDALDQHRLPGAVVAGERGDLPGRNVEVDADERLHRPEVLVDPAEPQERLRASGRRGRRRSRLDVGGHGSRGFSLLTREARGDRAAPRPRMRPDPVPIALAYACGRAGALHARRCRRPSRSARHRSCRRPPPLSAMFVRGHPHRHRVDGRDVLADHVILRRGVDQRRRRGLSRPQDRSRVRRRPAPRRRTACRPSRTGTPSGCSADHGADASWPGGRERVRRDLVLLQDRDHGVRVVVVRRHRRR